MGNQPEDTKLARRLQKRNVWPHYSACLATVRKALLQTDKTRKEIMEMIDRGELYPKS